VSGPKVFGFGDAVSPRLLGLDLQTDPGLLGPVAGPKALGLVSEPAACESGFQIAFKRGPKLLGLTLQSDSLKLGSDKFIIIIIIIKIIFIFIKIINIIINKFEKTLLILKNNH
jgi:hypothetical protein